MELVRGTVTDRPWGQTLGALGMRALTGQLTLQSVDGKQYCIAFDEGTVVGASSPLATDSVARIAVTNHLIPSTQIQAIARSLVAHPELDEFELLTKTCSMEASQALRLRQRVIAQRAARTFAINAGSFVVDDEITIPAAKLAAVDIRTIVYMGARLNLEQQRLVDELRQLGSFFIMKKSIVDADLSQFGLLGSEEAIFAALRRGTSVPELEAMHHELDPRCIQALLYALVSCFAVDVGQSASVSPRATIPPVMADGTQPPIAVTSRGTSPPPMGQPSRTSPPPLSQRASMPSTPPLLSPPIQPSQPLQSRTITTPPLTQPRTTTTPIPGRTTTPTPLPGRTTTPTSPPFAARPLPPPDPIPQKRVPASTTAERPVMFAARSGEVEMTPRTVTPTTTPPTVARTPSEPRVAVPRTTSSQRIAKSRTTTNPTQAVEEFGTRGSDPMRLATEHYERGQAALRVEDIDTAIAELAKATELNPHEFDYHAMYAWAQFCGSKDRPKIADKVRKMLGHAIQKSRQPEFPRLYLGRMERMLGRDREALMHFQQIIEVNPKHVEAAEELRALQAKLGSGEKPGLAGLFGRKKDR